MIMHICWPHTYDVRFPLHQIPREIYWIGIWRVWKKTVWAYLSFMTLHMIVLQSSIRRSVWCGRKEKYMFSGLWCLNNAQLAPRRQKKCQEILQTPLQQHNHPELVKKGRMDSLVHFVYIKFRSNHLNVSAPIKTQCSSKRLLSRFCESVWIASSLSCSKQKGLEHTWCGLLLLKPIFFMVWQVMHSEKLFCISWL